MSLDGKHTKTNLDLINTTMALLELLREGIKPEESQTGIEGDPISGSAAQDISVAEHEDLSICEDALIYEQICMVEPMLEALRQDNYNADFRRPYIGTSLNGSPEMDKAAGQYSERLKTNGCAGVCALHDTHVCGGSACGSSDAVGEDAVSGGEGACNVAVVDGACGDTGVPGVPGVSAVIQTGHGGNLGGNASGGGGVCNGAVVGGACSAPGAPGVPQAECGGNPESSASGGEGADGGCGSCAVYKSGMCVKRALLRRKFPQVREPDGQDYRSITGDEQVDQRLENEDFDIHMKEFTKLHSISKNDLEEMMRGYNLLGKRRNLECDWNDLSLNEVFAMYPGINKRESRIEVQMGIYTWMNYRNDLCCQHMSDRFGLPVRLINKYFKDYYGISFSTFLHKIRSEVAKRLFKIDSLRMIEISEIVGYKSSFHFSVNFKRVEGISPNIYKSLYVKR
jgi:AraC-like DNA-binding protein